jgi:hypothetical protein
MHIHNNVLLKVYKCGGIGGIPREVGDIHREYVDEFSCHAKINKNSD